MTSIPTPCSKEGMKSLKRTYPGGTELWMYICRGGYWELTDEKPPGGDVPWWCTEPTMHYNSGFEVLRHYDVNNNNKIDTTEAQRATADLVAGKINSGEAMIVRRGWLLGDAGFDSVCGRAPPPTSKPDCAKADINRDGIVDINDTILLGAAYGSHPGDPNWNPDADLNNDGVVDYKDMGLLGKCMGTVVTPPSKPECKEGDVKAGFVCSGGKWVPTGTTTPPVKPPVIPPTSKYLTPDEALLRIRAGEKCYIKCTLPILEMLPGIPYMQGIPILPGFAITIEP